MDGRRSTLRTSERGYGPAGHKRVRAAHEPLVASGAALCARCGEPILPTVPSTSDTTTSSASLHRPRASRLQPRHRRSQAQGLSPHLVETVGRRSSAGDDGQPRRRTRRGPRRKRSLGDRFAGETSATSRG